MANHKYRHTSTGNIVGSAPGTEMDKVLAADPDYEPVGKRPPVAQAAPETEPDKSQAPVEVDLASLSRDELNTLATEKGIENADQLPNKGAVRKAIEELVG